jgi:NADH dehydrogenase FAD-containing subunit
MSDERATIVIIGAGFGGIEAAKELRRASVEVTSSTGRTIIALNRCYIRSQLRHSLQLTWPSQSGTYFASIRTRQC